MGRPAGQAKVKEPEKVASKRSGMDYESQLLILDGASMEHLHRLFKMDKRTISSKIVGKVAPCGTRSGHPIWKVHEVAPYLVPPAGDFEQAIRTMHHDDIPPLVSKAYWAGVREKAKALEEEGILVNAHDAAELISKAFKSARMSILLLPDQLEREAVLSDAHRAVLKKHIDGLLVELRTNLTKDFTVTDPLFPNEEDDEQGNRFDDFSPSGEASEPAGEEGDYGGL